MRILGTLFPTPLDTMTLASESPPTMKYVACDVAQVLDELVEGGPRGGQIGECRRSTPPRGLRVAAVLRLGGGTDPRPGGEDQR